MGITEHDTVDVMVTVVVITMEGVEVAGSLGVTVKSAVDDVVLSWQFWVEFGVNTYGVTEYPDDTSIWKGARPSTELSRMLWYASRAVILLVTFANDVRFEICKDTNMNVSFLLVIYRETKLDPSMYALSFCAINYAQIVALEIVALEIRLFFRAFTLVLGPFQC